MLDQLHQDMLDQLHQDMLDQLHQDTYGIIGALILTVTIL